MHTQSKLYDFEKYLTFIKNNRNLTYRDLEITAKFKNKDVIKIICRILLIFKIIYFVLDLNHNQKYYTISSLQPNN